MRPRPEGKAEARVTACAGTLLVGLFTKRLTTAPVTRGRRTGGENPTPQMEMTLEAGIRAGRAKVKFGVCRLRLCGGESPSLYI